MGDDFPALKDIMDMRKDTNGAYSKFFCLHMLRPVVTEKAWKAISHRQKLSHKDFVTVTDESFALVILENNWTLWTEQGEDSGATAAMFPPKYTGEAKVAGRNKGWSLEGKKRLNLLTGNVREDRAMPHASVFEDAFLEARKTKKFTIVKRKPAELGSDHGENYEIEDELDDDDDDDDE